MKRNPYHYEEAPEFSGTYRIGRDGVAWRVCGWHTVPDEDTEWTGQEVRTGQLVCHMVGDDSYFLYQPDQLTPLLRTQFCSECGQIGCGHGAEPEEDDET